MNFSLKMLVSFRPTADLIFLAQLIGHCASNAKVMGSVPGDDILIHLF